MKIRNHFERFFDVTLSGLAGLSGILLVYVMLSVTLDVIMRYFLNKPQFWVGELSEYALLYITFTGTAWVLKRDSHVKIDILYAFLKQRQINILGLVSSIIGIFVCGPITVQR
jgi:C4-dicarboxylate transporter DctQ subunit